MKQKTIYTIGYEDATVDRLVDCLEQSGVETLIDVRAVPLSRKPGYSKNKLAARLAASGIDYINLKGLGTPAAGRDAARKGHTKEMQAIFNEHLETPEAKDDLKRAIEIAQKSPAVLLCREHTPGVCHRKIVAEVMAEKTGMKINHLDPING